MVACARGRQQMRRPVNRSLHERVHWGVAAFTSRTGQGVHRKSHSLYISEKIHSIISMCFTVWVPPSLTHCHQAGCVSGGRGACRACISLACLVLSWASCFAFEPGRIRLNEQGQIERQGGRGGRGSSCLLR